MNVVGNRTHDLGCSVVLLSCLTSLFHLLLKTEITSHRKGDVGEATDGREGLEGGGGGGGEGCSRNLSLFFF